MSYCTVEDVERRLSSVGLRYLIDDNTNEETETSELDFVQEAIDQTKWEVDLAVGQFLNNVADAYGNSCLQALHVDLACERLCQRKGQNAPGSVKVNAERSREKLDQIRTGEIRVPGLTYPGDSDDLIRRRMGLPLVANPKV